MCLPVYVLDACVVSELEARTQFATKFELCVRVCVRACVRACECVCVYLRAFVQHIIVYFLVCDTPTRNCFDIFPMQFVVQIFH